MQVMICLGDLGQIVHTEFMSLRCPRQLIALARARAEFGRVEVWEDAVCVLRCPPEPIGPPARR
jgi:hypothetical protein